MSSEDEFVGEIEIAINTLVGSCLWNWKCMECVLELLNNTFTCLLASIYTSTEKTVDRGVSNIKMKKKEMENIEEQQHQCS